MLTRLVPSCLPLLLLVMLASCRGPQGGWLTPRSTGRPGEVLVVADPALWDRPAGRSLLSLLRTDVPGLPQPEPAFRVMRASPRTFDATLKLVRNIVVVDVDAGAYSRVVLRAAHDVYASSQVILTVQAPGEAALDDWLRTQGTSLLGSLRRAEMNRSIRSLSRHHNARIAAEAGRLCGGGTVWLPPELQAMKLGTDFFWAGTNAARDDRNFVMYSCPCPATGVWTKEAFIHRRDSVMKANIPGARPGMYMATDSLMTDVRRLQVRGRPVLEVRGLWRMVGDMMGGPFVAHLRVDEARRRVLVAEVFVYAPGRPKRDLMRSLEASLYTWQLPGEETENERINHKE